MSELNLLNYQLNDFDPSPSVLSAVLPPDPNAATPTTAQFNDLLKQKGLPNYWSH